MAKLSRVTQLLFGSSAPASGTGFIAQFGSYAANAPIAATGPGTGTGGIQALAAFLGGWLSAVVGQNSPALEDMNALFYLAFYQIAYQMQAGIPEWDAATTYFKGSQVTGVLGANNGRVFVSLIDSNLANEPTADQSQASWKMQNGGVRTVTANTVLLLTDDVIRSDSTAGALTHTLPSISGIPTGTRFTIKDVGTGGYTTTVQGGASGGDLIDGNNVYATALGALDSMTVMSNGTSWDVL